MRLRHWRAAALLAALSLPAAAQENIGVTSAVQQRVVGSLGTQQRTLGPGDSVFQNETIATDAVSSSQLLFRDQTSLSVGPSSSVVLDEFVYDPRAANARVSMSMGRGVARFVTGVLQSQSYQIRTPTATIGVRGTTFDLFVAENGDTTVVIRSGAVEVAGRNAPGSVRLANAGQAVTVRSGQPPTPPGPVPPDVALALTRIPGVTSFAGGVPGAPPQPGGLPIPAQTVTEGIRDVIRPPPPPPQPSVSCSRLSTSC
jgi:hypothetical protein